MWHIRMIDHLFNVSAFVSRCEIERRVCEGVMFWVWECVGDMGKKVCSTAICLITNEETDGRACRLTIVPYCTCFLLFSIFRTQEATILAGLGAFDHEVTRSNNLLPASSQAHSFSHTHRMLRVAPFHRQCSRVCVYIHMYVCMCVHMCSTRSCVVERSRVCD